MIISSSFFRLFYFHFRLFFVLFVDFIHLDCVRQRVTRSYIECHLCTKAHIKTAENIFTTWRSISTAQHNTTQKRKGCLDVIEAMSVGIASRSSVQYKMMQKRNSNEQKLCREKKENWKRKKMQSKNYWRNNYESKYSLSSFIVILTLCFTAMAIICTTWIVMAARVLPCMEERDFCLTIKTVNRIPLKCLFWMLMHFFSVIFVCCFSFFWLQMQCRKWWKMWLNRC